MRKGEESNKVVKNNQINNDFFLHCDRKSRINDVAHRVELCMRSYEKELQAKREKLISLFTLEEEQNVRKFVEQAQSGNEAIWQDKQDRLKYLLEKRRKEQEAKISEIPVSKCVHANPCLVKARNKEMQQIHLYQMKEKQARKMAEKEMDHMWHELAMKESEALAARLEKDELDAFRRNMECLAHSDMMTEQRRRQREADRERLKAEQLAMKARFEEDLRKDKEAEERAKQKNREAATETTLALEELKRKRAETEANEKLIQGTWDNLTKGAQDDDTSAIERRKRIQVETNVCNAKLAALRDNMRRCDEADEQLRKVEWERQEKIFGRERCQWMLWSQKQNKERREAMLDHIKGRAQKSVVQKKLDDETEYQRQLFQQSQRLLEHKAERDLQERKAYQQDLLDQIAYNNLLKERARQEELDQIKKGELAKKEYEDEIRNIMLRPSATPQVHPFMRQMASGLQMPKKCPCFGTTYCAAPAPKQPPAPK